MEQAIEELRSKGQASKNASRQMACLSTDIKDNALQNIAKALIERREEILDANRIDCTQAEASSMGKAMLDRLMLSTRRIEEMAQDVRSVAALRDPVGTMYDARTLPNGLQIGKRRVPLGVIGAIYESRPNVTIDISALCLKSGNTVILRGGREAIHSNTALARVVQDAAADAGLPRAAVQLIESTERELVNYMLKMKGTIDLLVPRGGQELITMVSENATVPVVTGGVGVCHTYIDSKADFGKAVAIAYNAKVQRPTVCNALDTLLVHKDIAATYLPLIAEEWAKAGVEMHCDERSMQILAPIPALPIVLSSVNDWGREFLDLIAAIKIVDSPDEALDHIAYYGSGHSEAIVTEDYSTGMRFLNEVDAACVYINASTRFTDGAQFGLGAEIGVSTQKFHARGPMGLQELTTYKWIIMGDGHVRP